MGADTTKAPSVRKEIVVAAVAERELTLRNLQQLIQPRLKTRVEKDKIDKRNDPYTYRNTKRLIEEQVVVEWLSTTALAEEARSYGLTLSKSELDLALADLSKALGSASGEDSVTSLASASGIPKENIEQMLGESLLGDKFVRQYVSETVAEEALRKTYNENPQRFILQPRRRRVVCFRIRRVDNYAADLVTRREDAVRSTPPAPGPWFRGVDGEMLKVAEDALKRLSRGADLKDIQQRINEDAQEVIEKAAKKQNIAVTDEAIRTFLKSDEPGAYEMWLSSSSTTLQARSEDARNRDWARVDESYSGKRLYEEAFSLDIGQTSKRVIRSDVDYRVIKVVEEQPAQGVTFEECRGRIIEATIDSLRWPLSLAVMRDRKKNIIVYRKFLTQVEDDDAPSVGGGGLGDLAPVLGGSDASSALTLPRGLPSDRLR